jgi:two-component system response regulator PilR (NtrC family)
MQLALVVDDEPDIRELLELTLGRMNIDTRSAATLKEAMGLLQTEKFDVCLTDMRLPDGDGIDLVRHIQQQDLDIPVAVITAYGNMETAVEALKAGAFDCPTIIISATAAAATPCWATRRQCAQFARPLRSSHAARPPSISAVNPGPARNWSPG